MKKVLLLMLLVAPFASASLPVGYKKLNAEDKQSVLWQKLEAQKYNTLPPIPLGGWGSIFAKLKTVLTLNETFDHTSDEMPAARGQNKLLHSSGSVAQVQFVPSTDTPFTGTFRSGAIGLARLSLAGNPQALGSYTPGMALKFLLDGQASVNVAVMYSLDGQGEDTNFFLHSFSNRIPEPQSLMLKTLKLWFQVFVSNPLVLNVDHFASLNVDGSLVETPVVPYQLYFVPTMALQISNHSLNDFRADLAKIPAGSLLYVVMARRFAGDKAFEIGRLYTTSEMIASQYGDHQLFFQHRE